jgi:hypothetical protein
MNGSMNQGLVGRSRQAIGRAGLLLLVAVLGSCTENGKKAKNEEADTAATIAIPVVSVDKTGSGHITAVSSEKSPYASAFPEALPGALVAFTPDGGEGAVLIALSDKTYAEKIKGWKSRLVSDDPMWNPDRCSGIRALTIDDSLAFFETSTRAPGDAVATASPSSYQLAIQKNNEFSLVTPTPASEVALPKTLRLLGKKRIGYVWSNVAPQIGAAAGVPGSPVAASVPLTLTWREIDTDSMSVRDVPIAVEEGDELRSGYAQDDQTLLEFGGARARRMSVPLPTSEDSSITPVSAGISSVEKGSLRYSVSGQTLLRGKTKIAAFDAALFDVVVMGAHDQTIYVRAHSVIDQRQVDAIAAVDANSGKVDILPLSVQTLRCPVAVR